MDNIEKDHFLHTIFELRKHEDIILYSKLVTISGAEMILVNDLLEDDYQNEQTGYPFAPPEYDSEAALWAAKTFYNVAQLILYREHKETDLSALLPSYIGAVTVGAMLSADLCLRFLPQVKREARNIDPQDALLPEINKILNTWHYSGIGAELDLEQIDFATVLANPCMTRMYADRILLRKDRNMVRLPQWSDYIKGSMGTHRNIFWKELEF